MSNRRKRSSVDRGSGVAVAVPNFKVVSVVAMVALRDRLRGEGKVVVWTNGCFDLLHRGHVENLQSSRRLGDVLVVGLNSDRSVRRLKGPSRPIVSAEDRAAMLAALACVDFVVIFDEQTPERAIEQIKPDVCSKGLDYAPPHGKPIPEKKIVDAYGGRFEFLPLCHAVSTTELIRRIIHSDAAHPEEMDERYNGQASPFRDLGKIPR